MIARRYWLKGAKAGTSEPFVTKLPGLPDGISRAADGGYWVAINAQVIYISTALAWELILPA